VDFTHPTDGSTLSELMVSGYASVIDGSQGNGFTRMPSLHIPSASALVTGIQTALIMIAAAAGTPTTDMPDKSSRNIDDAALFCRNICFHS